jgi:hypothetical protein
MNAVSLISQQYLTGLFGTQKNASSSGNGFTALMDSIADQYISSTYSLAGLSSALYTGNGTPAFSEFLTPRETQPSGEAASVLSSFNTLNLAASASLFGNSTSYIGQALDLLA